MKITRDSLFGFMIACSAISGIHSVLPLGELSYEAYTLPLLLFIVFGIAINKWYVKNVIAVFVFTVVCVLIISFLLNAGHISGHSFKGKSGVGKFVGQFVLVVIFLFYSGILFHTYKGRSVYLIGLIKKYSVYMFYIVFLYSAVEFISIFSASANKIIVGIDNIIRDPTFSYYNTRLRGLQYESPAFGAYLGIMCIVFLDNAILEKRKIFFIYYGIAILLSILSGSRTGIIICFLLSFFYMFSLTKAKIVSKKYIIYSFCLIIVLFVSSTTLREKLQSVINWTEYSGYHAASNFVRFGSQLAALNMAIDNPLTGIGFGQYGFLVKDYYPSYIREIHTIKMYSNNAAPNWPPAYSFVTRMLAEFGLVISFAFFVLAGRHFLKIYRKITTDKDSHKYVFLLNLFFYSFLIFLQFDSIRNIHFWNFLSLYFIASYEDRHLNIS
ncbi:MAG: oligosaccharide repeat unit polymerase [Cyclobacteriaceae bacterium]